MDNTLGIICEIVVLVLNILIYMELTVLKKDTKIMRTLMYIGSAIVLTVFFICTYFFQLPEALASFLCVTLPTFAFFFAMSKHKDFRFFVTFCFLDTVTLIITFFSRMADILAGHAVGLIVSVAIVLVMVTAYVKGKKLFEGYRELLRNVNSGWGGMALATGAIYILLIFTASYPKPLAERTEYLVPYAVLSVSLLAVYAVFVLALLEKKKLCDLNEQLINEKKWHKIAYVDALTGLKNRMAYIETINELEREKSEETPVYAIMIDIDNFKLINDSLGHQMGDQTLQRTAEHLKKHFTKENYKLFRIGGDEFAAIALYLTDEEVAEKLESVSMSCAAEVGCTISVGMSKVNPQNNRALEVAFATADKKMYEQKMQKTPVQ